MSTLHRSPLPRVSKKRRKQAGARRECIRLVKARSHNLCEVMQTCCTMIGVDAHEKLPRSAGGDPCDPANVLWCCRKCHDWLHAHPRLARAGGWLVSRYAKGEA